jgi:hypothetical protein
LFFLFLFLFLFFGALLVYTSRSLLACWAPQVLALIGAFGGGLIAFVMPSFAYTALFRGELPPLRRFFCTVPGWCSVLSTVFLLTNTSLVIQGIVEANEDGVDRSCAPPLDPT